MDTKEINHIAKLARLKFDESGVDSMAKDLNDILKWMLMSHTSIFLLFLRWWNNGRYNIIINSRTFKRVE